MLLPAKSLLWPPSNDQIRLQPMDGVVRVAARMIVGVPKYGHISDYILQVISDCILLTIRNAKINLKVGP